MYFYFLVLLTMHKFNRKHVICILCNWIFTIRNLFTSQVTKIYNHTLVNQSSSSILSSEFGKLILNLAKLIMAQSMLVIFKLK